MYLHVDKQWLRQQLCERPLRFNFVHIQTLFDGTPAKKDENIFRISTDFRTYHNDHVELLSTGKPKM